MGDWDESLVGTAIWTSPNAHVVSGISAANAVQERSPMKYPRDRHLGDNSRARLRLHRTTIGGSGQLTHRLELASAGACCMLQICSKKREGIDCQNSKTELYVKLSIS